MENQEVVMMIELISMLILYVIAAIIIIFMKIPDD
jgi:hypothetical protein